MDKEETLIIVRLQYEEEVRNIEKAYEIFKLLEPTLPPGWKAEYDEHLRFYKLEKSDIMEFRTVCSFVEEIIGQNMRRWATGKHSFSAAHFFSGDDFGFFIYISAYNGYGCEVKATEKLVTVYEADPKCLGGKDDD